MRIAELRHILTMILSVSGLLNSSLKCEEVPPNIIFILTDDLGPGDVGFAGGSLAKTPNIDRIASEGIQFQQYYSAAPICSPSRCGLITGQFPARWNIHSYLQTRAGNRECGQADFLVAKAPSLPRVLQKSGYKTAHFGKWHLGGGRDVKNAPKFAAYGYDEHASTWESPEPHPDITSSDWIWAPTDKFKRWERTQFFVDKTLDFLKHHNGKPCFVNLWLDDPHTPWVPSAEAPKGTTKPNLKAVMEENDRQIGRLLDGIKAMGLDDKTLVIFTSDNGPLPTFERERTTGLRGSKLSLFEGGIRLPFAARWPGHIPAGKLNQQTVLSALDIYPTFLSLAGIAMDQNATDQPDGQDMSEALLGKSSPDRQKPLYWEYGRNSTSYAYPKKAEDRSPTLAIRSGDWTLLTDPDGKKTYLFEVVKDQNESQDVAAEHPEIAEKLKNEIMKWKASLPVFKPTP